jgi:hypothetical protein
MGVGAEPTGTRALGARQVRIDAQGGVDRAVAGVGCLVLAPRRPAPLSACASSPRARAFRHHHVEIVHLSSVIPLSAPGPGGDKPEERAWAHVGRVDWERGGGCKTGAPELVLLARYHRSQLAASARCRLPVATRLG